MQLRSHYPYPNPTSCHPIRLTLFLHSSTLTHLFHSLSIVVHPPTLQRRDSLLYTPLTPPSPLPTPHPYPSITTHASPPQSPFRSLAILTHHQSHPTAILFHPHPAPTYSTPTHHLSIITILKTVSVPSHLIVHLSILVLSNPPTTYLVI